MQLGKFLMDLRDRVIHRSQLGKRKLDLAFTRRELDDKLRLLGERYRRLVREGRVEASPELLDLVAAAEALEERLVAGEDEVTRMSQEGSSEAEGKTT